MEGLEKYLERWQGIVLNYIPKVILSLIILIIFYFIAKILKKLSLKFYLRMFKKQVSIAKITSKVIYFFFLLSGMFLALEILGLGSLLTKLLAGAGIVGIVAGFAFKDIASNLFAGFLLNTQRPFRANDWVKIDDHFGKVKNIGLITTSINSVTGQEVFIPNQLIYNDSFTNYSTFRKRRVVLKTGVSYGDDLDIVRSSALDEVQKIDSLLKDEEIDFYFTEIGASSYNFELRFWIRFKEQKDYLSAMNETIMRIKKRFEKENISIAYSVMTLDFGVKGGVNLYDNPIEIDYKNN